MRVSDGLRSTAVAAIAPPWRLFSYFKKGCLYAATIWPSGGYYASPEIREEIASLRLENHHLQQQVELLKAQIDLEKLIGEEAQLLKRFETGEGAAKRRRMEIERLLEMYMPAVIAQVVFRESASWASTLWINLGNQSNAEFGKVVIAKNSPVVLGTSLVGIVEYVGEHRSRVRLMTDPLIAPSVRVLREDKNLYLAKGEMNGVRTSLLRNRSTVLRGVGFNYDFEDEEGPSRNLVSTVPLIQKGDLLVTTGMDGVFPSGLKVGQVSHVYPLCEGGSAYEVDAAALAGNFNDISFVMILPPLYDDFSIDKE